VAIIRPKEGYLKKRRSRGRREELFPAAKHLEVLPRRKKRTLGGKASSDLRGSLGKENVRPVNGAHAASKATDSRQGGRVFRPRVWPTGTILSQSGLRENRRRPDLHEEDVCLTVQHLALRQRDIWISRGEEKHERCSPQADPSGGADAMGERLARTSKGCSRVTLHRKKNGEEKTEAEMVRGGEASEARGQPEAQGSRRGSVVSRTSSSRGASGKKVGERQEKNQPRGPRSPSSFGKKPVRRLVGLA